MLLQTLLRPLREPVALGPLVVLFVHDIPVAECRREPLVDELDVREDLMLSEILTTRHAALFSRVPGRRGIGIGFAGRGGHFLFSFLFFALFPFFPSFFFVFCF